MLLYGSDKTFVKSSQIYIEKMKSAFNLSDYITTEAEKYRDDLKSFMVDFMPSVFNRPFNRFHNEIIPILNSIGKKKLSLLVVAPREHGKSKICAEAFPLWNACYRKSKFTLIVSDTAEQARGRLRNIKAITENDFRFRQVFPNLNPKLDKYNKVVKYTDSDIILENDTRILAVGAGTSLRGIDFGNTRPQLIILDDIEEQSKVRSEVQRQYLYEWFWQVIENIGSKYTNKIVIGNFLHYDSLLYNLYQDENSGFETYLYRAIEPDGTPLWKGYYTVDDLMEKRRKNPKAFEIEWMNNPNVQEEIVFDLDKIRQYAYNPNEIVDLSLYKATYIDLSMGRSNTSDYTAIITAGRDKKGNIYILDAVIIRKDPTALLDLIIDIVKYHRSRLIGIEANTFQALYVSQLYQKMEEHGYKIPVKEVKHHSDKILRIQAVAPELNTGIVRIPFEYFKDRDNLFIQQLQFFPNGKYDDAPDALEGVISMLKNDKIDVTGIQRLNPRYNNIMSRSARF